MATTTGKFEPYCRAKNNYGYGCYKPAPFGVYWQTDGGDEVHACAQHLAKVLRELQKQTNNGREKTFRVRFLASSTTPSG